MDPGRRVSLTDGLKLDPGVVDNRRLASAVPA
jgi:hypothetical protein